MTKINLVWVSVVIFCALMGASVWMVKTNREAQIKKIIAKHELAMSYFKQGNKFLDEKEYDKAIVAFEKVLEIEPKNLHAKENIQLLANRINPTDDNSRILKFAELFNGGKLNEAETIANAITDVSLKKQFISSIAEKKKMTGSGDSN